MLLKGLIVYYKLESRSFRGRDGDGKTFRHNEEYDSDIRAKLREKYSVLDHSNQVSKRSPLLCYLGTLEYARKYCKEILEHNVLAPRDFTP